MSVLRTEVPRFEQGERADQKINSIVQYLYQLQDRLDYVLSQLRTKADMKKYYTSEEVDSRLKSKVDTEMLGDYVVEVGSRGNLTWRKWASGISELWGYYDVSAVPCTTATGALYVTGAINPGVAFPSGVFKADTNPTVSMTFHSVQGYPAFIWIAASTAVQQGLTPFRLMRQSAATISGRMEYVYKGRWQ